TRTTAAISMPNSAMGRRNVTIANVKMHRPSSVSVQLKRGKPSQETRASDCGEEGDEASGGSNELVSRPDSRVCLSRTFRRPAAKYRSRTRQPALKPDLRLSHCVRVAGKQQGVVFGSSQAADASRRRRLHFEFAKPRQENGIHIPARVTEVGRGTPG